MVYRILSLLIVVALLLGLVGCDTNATPEPTATPTSPPEPTATPTSPPEPTSTPTSPPEPTATPTPTSPPEPQAAFEEAPCPFDLPPGQTEGETVECGYLVVPEDREDPASPTIRLPVAIFRHPDGDPEPDPILYLEGGPGGSALEWLGLTFEEAYAPLWDANRDLILFDQRGVGLAEPALDCPAIAELSRELLDHERDGQQFTEEEMTDLVREAILACGEELAAAHDLADYNTAANAADVDDLRLALGYDQVNLWGVSYGTRLALEVMRNYPEGLRSVVLDSVYPPDADLYVDTPANAARAMDTLFDACAADPACDAAYPDLRTVLFDTVALMNETPAEVEIVDTFSRESYDALLTGDDLLAFLFQFLYYTDVIPSLPQVIYDASQGRYDTITLIAGLLLAQQGLMSHGMHLSVQCHDEMAFSSFEAFEAALAEQPELVPVFEDALVGGLGYQVCQGWDSGAADPVANEAVTSDVPTLVLSGEYDPITPPAWGQQVVETLANGHFFQFPGMGHGVSVSGDCPRSMMIAFLDDPSTAPDDACLADMAPPVFASAEGQEVELEPFANEAMGISGLVPSGWEEVSLGTYARGSSALDVAVLLLQAAPMTAADLLDLLTGQLGLDETPEAVGEREANDLVWALYAVDIAELKLDIALADADGLALVVLMQSSPGEHDTLYESVFLPAVDALVPAP